jgi:hypothetical protein
MRLSEILVSPSPPITEAARFGNTEKAAVLKKIDQFRFGIEYEFIVSDRFGAINYVDSLMDNPKKADFTQKADGHIITMSQAYESLARSLSLDDLVGLGGYLQDALDGSLSLSEAMSWVDDDKRELREYFSNVIKVVAASMGLMKLEPDLTRLVGIGLFKNTSAPTINLFKRLNTALQRVDASSNEILIESFAEDFIKFVTIWSMHLNREVLRFRIGTSRTVISDIIDNEIGKIYDDLYPSTGEVINKVDWVANNLPKHVNPRMIEKVVPDVTVGNGVEVVSRPLGFDDAVSFMDQMFTYMTQVGGTTPTDGSTGMHLNVSYVGDSFSKMNAVKAMTLIDDIHQMYGQNSDGVIRWSKRITGAIPNHTAFLQKDVNGDTHLHSLAKTYVRNGAEAFIREYENVLLKYGRDEKYLSFNIKNFIAGDVGTKRIEWRVMGGGNYHQRRDTIIHDMMNVCYVILAGMDESFLRKEYLQSIIRMLNKIAIMGGYASFVDLVGYYR